MHEKFLLAGIAGTVCVVALFAADSWKNKDYTQWTDVLKSQVPNALPTWTVPASACGPARNHGG